MTTGRDPGESRPPPDLAPIAIDRSLPVSLHPPVLCAAVEGWLHLAGVDPITGTSRHLVLNAEGEPVGDTTPWPLRAAALAPTVDGLIATGSRPGGGPPVVFGVDRAGAIRWRHDLVVGERGRVVGFPRPVPLGDDGRIAVIWQTGAPNPALWIADLLGETLGPARSLPIEDVTVDLDVDGAAGALTFARVVGYPLRLEVLRAGESPVRRRLEDAHQPETATVAAGGRILVAWSSLVDGLVRVQVLSDELAPLRPPVVVAEVAWPERIRDVRFCRGGRGHLTLNYRTSRGGAQHVAPGEPTVEVELFVAPIDGGTGMTGPARRIGAAGLGYDAASWSGARLFVSHGTAEPLITILEARSAPSSETS